MLELLMNQDFKELMADEIRIVGAKDPICPMLLGEPGIGKSSVVREICEQNDWDFFELLCNQLGDRSDLTGCRTVKDINPKTKEEVWSQIFFPHKAVQSAIQRAADYPDRTIVLFLDEINRTTSDITSAILSFTTARTIGTYTFPTNVRFIVAGNDKGNVVSLDEASLSRFAMYKLKPSAQTWMQITSNVNPYIKSVLEKNPSLIFCKSTNVVTSQVQGSDDDDDSYGAEYEAFDENADGFNQITTPRTISGLNSLMNSWDLDKIKYYIGNISKDSQTGEDCSMLQTIIEAHVGKTAFAAELCQELANAVKANVLNTASNLVIPTKPAQLKQLALVTDRQSQIDLLKNMSPEELSEIMAYLVYQPGVDNKDIITMIAGIYPTNSLDKNVMPNFIKLKTHDKLNPDNYTALINSGTLLGTGVRDLLGD